MKKQGYTAHSKGQNKSPETYLKEQKPKSNLTKTLKRLSEKCLMSQGEQSDKRNQGNNI